LSGENDDPGDAAVRGEPVTGVGHALGQRGPHVPGADDTRQRVDERIRLGGGGHVVCSIWGCRPPRPLPLARRRTAGGRAAAVAGAAASAGSTGSSSNSSTAATW